MHLPTMDILMLLAGLALLVAGGDLLVRGAVAIARHLRVSPLLIGLTLVGFGTSTPELITSLQAAVAGSPGIAVGNVVGSNIANILLILGLSAMVFPLWVQPQALRRDGAVALLAALLCVGAVFLDLLNRATGAGLLGALIAFVVYTYRRERRTEDASARMHAHESAAAAAEPAPTRMWLAAAFAAAGLLLMVFGARTLVSGAIALARVAEVPETVVGLTIVAVGTSLPELVTSVVAAFKRQADIAFGNILGSNIFNILGILGVTALVTPIPAPAELVRLDVWVMLGATVLLLAASATGGRLSRIEGLSFLAAYGAYVGYLLLR